jgi:DNA polymerase delta subunit 1
MPSQFEADLAMMDIDELENDVALGDGPENQQTSQKWARPDLPPINPKTDAVVFQQLDVDHYVGHPMVGMPGAQVKIEHQRR